MLFVLPVFLFLHLLDFLSVHALWSVVSVGVAVTFPASILAALSILAVGVGFLSNVGAGGLGPWRRLYCWNRKYHCTLDYPLAWLIPQSPWISPALACLSEVWPKS